MFNLLSFLLQFRPTHPSEVDLMGRFGKIGVGAGRRIDELTPDIEEALGQGVADAWTDFGDLKKRVDAGEVTSGQMFGTREFLQNNYLYRMAGAVLGIYGNSSAEAMYPLYNADADGQLLDGTYRYTLRFAPGQLPARPRVLVSDDVRAAVEPSRGQSPESLLDQLPDAASA